MDWLRESGLWIVVGVLFVWMHVKMHGGHGHGGGCGHGAGHGHRGGHGRGRDGSGKEDG